MGWLSLVVLAALLTLAAVGDVRRYLIPNWLCLAVAVAGVVFAWPGGLEAWGWRGASIGTVAAVGLALWLLRVLGGGDYKLLVALAFWIPFGELLDFVVLLALAGGAQALATLLLRRFGRPRDGAPPGKMPYAVSIAVAGIAWGALSLT
jgi:prepilin peptidase CpaA